MKYRILSHTDIRVSSVCFGCWGIIGGFNWGAQAESDSIKALHTAFDSGINFYDTAEAYGEGKSEQLLASALGHKRDQIVIATKVSPNHFSPDALRAACERSLRNLNTDRIDLYQMHWPNHDIPVAETLHVLNSLKAEGKIRAYGVSNFAIQDLGEVNASPYRVCSNQLSYSLLFRAIEYEVLPLCIRSDISVLTYSTLMQGLLSGKYTSANEVQPDRARTRHYAKTRPYARHNGDGAEDETFKAVADIRAIAAGLNLPMADVALAWAIAQPGITSVIAGARNAEQSLSIASAAAIELPKDVLAQLDKDTRQLKEKLGTNPDMWQTTSRMR